MDARLLPDGNTPHKIPGPTQTAYDIHDIQCSFSRGIPDIFVACRFFCAVPLDFLIFRAFRRFLAFF
jgi:hypothetical protein